MFQVPEYSTIRQIHLLSAEPVQVPIHFVTTSSQIFVRMHRQEVIITRLRLVIRPMRFLTKTICMETERDTKQDYSIQTNWLLYSAGLLQRELIRFRLPLIRTLCRMSTCI